MSKRRRGIIKAASGFKGVPQIDTPPDSSRTPPDNAAPVGTSAVAPPDALFKPENVRDTSGQPTGDPILDPNVDSNLQEFGSTGLLQFGGIVYDDPDPGLQGIRGYREYTNMVRNDGLISGMQHAIRMMIRQVKWPLVAAEPEKGCKTDPQMACDFVESCREDMQHSWNAFIDETNWRFPYGYQPFEIVYKLRNGPENDDGKQRSKYEDGLVGWRKFAPRSQATTYRWVFDVLEDLVGWIQIAPPKWRVIFLPYEKMLNFRTVARLNNPESVSLYRGAYRHWKHKKRIEELAGIGIERDLAGLPVCTAPMEYLAKNAETNKKAFTQHIITNLKNIRRNTQEGWLGPSDVYQGTSTKMFEFSLLSSSGQRQLNIEDRIKACNMEITVSILADWLIMGHENVGSFSLHSDKTDIFVVALAGLLDMLADEFNTAITRLLRLNGMDPRAAPRLTHGDTGKLNLKDFAAALLTLTQAGAPIFPNEDLEKKLFAMLGVKPPSPEELAEAQEQNRPDKAPEASPGGSGEPKPPKDTPDETTPPEGAEKPLEKSAVAKVADNHENGPLQPIPKYYEKTPTVLLDTVPIRQQDDYKCGVMCADEILVRHGVQERVDGVSDELGAKHLEENGVDERLFPKVLEKHGLHSEVVVNMTRDQLTANINADRETAVLVQAWPYEPGKDNQGHYALVIGMDDGNVYFDDPATFNRDFLPWDEFIKRWYVTGSDGKLLTAWGCSVSDPVKWKSTNFERMK